jgi:putative nucleotidyltransferase with HDIG domain
MLTDVTPAKGGPGPLTAEELAFRLADCTRLPSLGRVNHALHQVLREHQKQPAQVAEIIRRDPSLAARLLRLVNSVYSGLSTPINSIEEAVLFLGDSQIRQLAMVTPLVEDLQTCAGLKAFDWHQFWQHCIATAILTQEVLSIVEAATDEIGYLAGLLHDVGKIAMASAFPLHFRSVHIEMDPEENLLEVEKSILGADHTEIGAAYLASHHLPGQLVAAVRYHHQPELAPDHRTVVAAVHLADLLVRHAGIGCSGNLQPVSRDDWTGAKAWDLLFPLEAQAERAIARNTLFRKLEQLPALMSEVV